MVETFGSLKLPWRIPLALAALGLEIDCVIGTRDVRILLPRAADEYYLQAPQVDDQFMAQSWQGVEWGELDNWDRPCVGALGIVFDLLEEDASGALSELSWHTDSWLRRWRGWMSARHVDVQINSAVKFEELRYHLTLRDRGPVAIGQRGKPGMVRGQGVLTFDELDDAAQRASREEEVPLAFSLLDSAHELMLEEGGARRSVIDSASAVEVALSSLLMRRLTAIGVVEEKNVPFHMKQMNGIVQLANAAMLVRGPLGVSLQRISNEIASPRNAAAHAGEAVDVGIALKALGTAEIVVRSVEPLPPVAPPVS